MLSTDCNNHGTMLNEKCSCDLGWFNNSTYSYCTINGTSK